MKVNQIHPEEKLEELHARHIHQENTIQYCYMVVIMRGVYASGSTTSDVLLLSMFSDSSSKCHGLVFSE